MLIITTCPRCHVPAEVASRFWLPRTDGPAEHVAVRCTTGHHFRIPASLLPAPLDEPLTRAQHAAERLIGELADQGLTSGLRWIPQQSPPEQSTPEQSTPEQSRPAQAPRQQSPWEQSPQATPSTR